jgi:DNA polymerase elongation subunit (family B)
MLERLTQIIREKDPDVITGYRLTRFDLPCIIRRADHCGIRLEWGRDGSIPHLQQGADTCRFQKNHAIYGRSVIDTIALVRQYDLLVRPLPGTDLQQVAEWFGCVAEQDATVTGLQTDTHTCISLYQLLAPVWHLQAQLYPSSFQSAVSRPGVSAVSALLTQRYLLQQHALPAPVKGATITEQWSGQLFKRGQTGPVALCDLSALPTSIMLAYRIVPHGDDLHIFLPLLRSITQLCSHNSETTTLPLQPFLLPAWYELLGHDQFPFSDSEAAGEVKRLGRVLTGDLLGWLKEQGAEPIAADQRGIYFMPPRGHNGTDEIAAVMKHLERVLPNGANLRCSGYYQSMFNYSLSNYALLEKNGAIVYRGSRLFYRSMEPFLREFLRGTLALLLEGKAEEIRNLYVRYLRKLVAHDCPVDWLIRTETLADTLENYRASVAAGKRNRAAVYELALSAPEKLMVGDRISYYVAGNAKHGAVHDNCRFITDFDPAHPDLNIPWYTGRLDQLFKRFEPFLPAEPTLF